MPYFVVQNLSRLLGWYTVSIYGHRTVEDAVEFERVFQLGFRNTSPTRIKMITSRCLPW